MVSHCIPRAFLPGARRNRVVPSAPIAFQSRSGRRQREWQAPRPVQSAIIHVGGQRRADDRADANTVFRPESRARFSRLDRTSTRASGQRTRHSAGSGRGMTVLDSLGQRMDLLTSVNIASGNECLLLSFYGTLSLISSGSL